VEGRAGFVRAIPGHEVFDGVTEFLDFNHFRSIAIDDDGLIWTGGPSGVARLDPATGTFTPLTGTDGTGPLDVRRIAIGRDGSAWAATDRGLSHWVDGEWDYDSRLPTDHDRETEITDLQIASDGRVFVAAHSWSETWESESVQIYWGEAPFLGDVAAVTVPGWVSDLTAGPSGEMWATGEGGLWRFEGKWARQAVTGLIHGEDIEAATDGILWITSGERLWWWDRQELRVHEVEWRTAPTDPDPDEGWESEGWIRDLAAGPDGSMWALANRWDPTAERESTELVRFDRTGTSTLPLPALSNPGWYEQLAVAPDGTVWLAASTVVVRYHDGIVTEFRVEDSPVIHSPSDLAVSSDGKLWMATDTHLARWGRDGREIVSGPDFGLPDGDEPNPFYGRWSPPWWVEAGSDGSLWAGQGCRAARSTEDGWVTLPPLPAESADCWDESIGVAPDGSVWLAPTCCSGGREPLFRWMDETWEVFPIEFRLDSFTVADDGTVWATGDSGLTRFDGGEWVPVIEGLWFNDVIATSDETIWALESDWPQTAAIWHYDAETWERTQVDAQVKALHRAADGEAWALTRRADGRSSLLKVASGRTRWVVEASTHVLTTASDGTAWVGGHGRLYRVDPIG
jgi:hypothetical protein